MTRRNLFKINCALREVNSNYRKGQNAVKIEAGNTLEHEKLKFLICFILRNNKHEYITEARFNKGGRADVYDLSNKVVYEVLHTEDERKFEVKIEKYPECEIIKIHTQHYKDLSCEDIISKLIEIMVL